MMCIIIAGHVICIDIPIIVWGLSLLMGIFYNLGYLFRRKREK